MLIFVEKHVLVATISCKGYRGDAETREASLEAVPPSKGPVISPLLTIWGLRMSNLVADNRCVFEK